MALVDQIVGAESGGNPLAKNPNSSAEGLGQFIDSTWLSMVSKYRPDLAEGKSQADILALKKDPGVSRAMVDAYAGENAKTLTAAGLPVNPGSLYLAHFSGPQGAVNLLKADPGASAAEVLGAGAAKANPFLRNMSVSDLQRWASGKVGGGQVPAVTAAATGVAPAAPTAPTGPAAPMGMLDANALGSASPLALPTQAAAPVEQASSMPQLMPFRHLPLTAAVRSRLLTSVLNPTRA